MFSPLGIRLWHFPVRELPGFEPVRVALEAHGAELRKRAGKESGRMRRGGP